jgi:hypothetical protein
VTREQASRLEQIFEQMGERAKAKKMQRYGRPGERRQRGPEGRHGRGR